ncbi:MAG: hypothetical protein RMK91_04540 [Pseudanabaenaceae cyanobacterium SKYGB_i_bin29]|nr:hypothetical protein [Pseudanabaenaceae cyanobacterium SKYG29]MDW8421112.1 hypothetical protein [Pseudanabaenaceae cyanobacterium SKYGB_i_bin29]
MRGILRWLRGIWTSFCRWLNRLLRPNRLKYKDRQLQAQSELDIPITGISHIDGYTNLTVSGLLSKVQWQLSKPSVSLDDRIKWD